MHITSLCFILPSLHYCIHKFCLLLNYITHQIITFFLSTMSLSFPVGGYLINEYSVPKSLTYLFEVERYHRYNCGAYSDVRQNVIPYQCSVIIHKEG